MNFKLSTLSLSLCLLASASGFSAASQDEAQRIVGGVDFNIEDVPSTVALIFNPRAELDGELSRSVFCGGTVIAPRWVLTAAHCVVDDNNTPNSVEDMSVLMGTTDLTNPVNQTVQITEIIVHEDYADFTNDIALLRLEFDALVPSATLDTQNTTLNDIGIIAGWGALNSGSNGQTQELPTTLQGTSVRMIPGEDCGDIAPAYAGLTDGRNICAGLPEGGRDSCQGDSGGPMYRFSEETETIVSVAGIVSWGFGCAEAEHPGVYTNVAAFGDWIDSRIGSGDNIPDDETDIDEEIIDEEDTDIAETDQEEVDQEDAEGEETIRPLDELNETLAGSAGTLLLSLLGMVLMFRRLR